MRWVSWLFLAKMAFLIASLSESINAFLSPTSTLDGLTTGKRSLSAPWAKPNQELVVELSAGSTALTTRENILPDAHRISLLTVTFTVFVAGAVLRLVILSTAPLPHWVEFPSKKSFRGSNVLFEPCLFKVNSFNFPELSLPVKVIWIWSPA